MIILPWEGGLPMKELEEQNPHTPNIEAEVMGLVEDHFWGHIVEGSTKGLPRPRGRVLSAPPKIT